MVEPNVCSAPKDEKLWIYYSWQAIMDHDSYMTVN